MIPDQQSYHLVLAGQDAPERSQNLIFFDYRDQVRVGLTQDVTSAILLESGRSAAKNFNLSYPRAIQFYEYLLAHSAGRFGRYAEAWKIGGNPEILLGRLCWIVSHKLARLELQVSGLPSNFEYAPVNTVRLSSHAPESSSQSFLAAVDPNLAAVSQASLLRIMRDVELRLEIEPTAHVEASAAPNSQSLWKVLLRHVSRLWRMSSRHTIVDPYLGRKNEVLLNLSLGQLPPLIELERLSGNLTPIYRPLDVLRHPPNDIFELGARIIDHLAPASLVENYGAVKNELKEQKWPQNPRSIFTSNSFESNDLFKVYVCERGARTPYFVGQHGNNYGVARTIHPIPELRTADSFLSWGWLGDRVMPTGMLKPVFRLPSSFAEQGPLVLLRDKLSVATYLDADEEYNNYFDSVTELVGHLIDSLGRVSIKPHGSRDSISITRIAQLQKDFPALSVVSPSTSLKKCLASGFAPVFTYDSTGMLELGVSGIPFYAFLPEGTEHVEEQYVQNYSELMRAGLLHYDAMLSAKQIEKWLREPTSNDKLAGLEGFTRGIAHVNLGLVKRIRRILTQKEWAFGGQ